MNKTRMWKKKTKHWLPHDVVERIMERLAVKTLVRLKTVSKQWKSTIESRFFQEKQLKRRQESGDPDVLMVSMSLYPEDESPVVIDSLRTLELRSSSSVKIPTPWEEDYHYFVSQSSCDGLVCLYHIETTGFVVNPTTRWYRPLPLSNFQQIVIDLGAAAYFDLGIPVFKLGFGKDKFSGTCKPVWLYNSSEFGLDNATTCQVFDFSTDAWRYVTPSSPYRILASPDPVFVDGSIYWFTDCQETKLFKYCLKLPCHLVMSNLDNRLCVSQMKYGHRTQVIWSFHSGNKTWDKLCSIDIMETLIYYHIPLDSALFPLALLDGEKTKNKLLLYDRLSTLTLLIHDTKTISSHAAFSADSISADSLGFPVCYFPSLISIL